MGKQKLIIGTLTGTLIGGLAALCDKETRKYAKGKMHILNQQATYYMKHPSEAVQNVKDTCNAFNESVTSGADNAINALEQVEETITKISEKKQG